MTVKAEDILSAIRAEPDRLTRKDIAKRLKITSDDRRELRSILRDMVEAGQLVLSSKKTYRERGELPAVMVIRITHIDDFGDMVGEPEPWKGDGEPPQLIVTEGPISRRAKGHKTANLGVGGRALCRIKKQGETLHANVMKKLGHGPVKRLGILCKQGHKFRIKPIDKKSRSSFFPTEFDGPFEQDLLVQYSTNRDRSRDMKRANVHEVIGPADAPFVATLISLTEHNIPIGFSDETEAELINMSVPELGLRDDLTHLPLITIDPADAKDFDDAVLAVPDDDPKNKGGWVIWVAIADVAHYVTPQSALDEDARKKGNSTYLPDRVEPMLPHGLSSDLCSLRPKEIRAAMVAQMNFRADGSKRSHKFKRALICSHARLTYGDAQSAFDERPTEVAKTVIDELDNLKAAFTCLKKARDQRAPLEINLPERRIRLNDQGDVTSIDVKIPMTAHKLVEEFMIQANVSAAQTLGELAMQDKALPIIARLHEPPSREKLQGLSDFLPHLGLKWAMGERATPRRFNILLGQSRKIDLDETVSMAVLRTQSQAFYSPDKQGHFGLNLKHYTHFTSPIRRYADLLVHRALIAGLGFGEDGLSEGDIATIKETTEHISDMERRSMAAERDAKDRYIARYLEGRVGAKFNARISGVTRVGLFLTLDDTGADGFVPAASLGCEYYIFDEKSRKLIGEDTGDHYGFGARVKVRLLEVTPLSGGLLFEMISPPDKGKRPPKGARGRHSRGGYSRGGGRGKKSSSGRNRGGGRTRSGSSPIGSGGPRKHRGR